MTIGVVMIASASASLDKSAFHLQFWRSPFGRQAVFVVIGFLTIVAVSRLGRVALAWNARTWRRLATALFVLTIASLVAVLIPGISKEVHGARRWIQFGQDEFGLRFQPSELAKLTTVIVLAVLFSRSAAEVRSFWRGLLPGIVVVGLTAGLVGLEDFGTAVLLAAVGGAVLLVGGCRSYQLVLMSIPAVAALWYLLASQPYRLARLASFRNIWSDAQGAGYHPIQSLVTIASGGWLGRGLGAGIQKYGYLPESRTDFIFSVICEEAGALGGILVILMFITLVWLGGKATLHATDPFRRLLAFGATLTLGLQAAMNIAVVTVCVPTKGMALPLVSAGGSGIVFLGTAIGLLAAVAAGGDYTRLSRPAPAETLLSAPSETVPVS